jgi:surface-anchored protein
MRRPSRFAVVAAASLAVALVAGVAVASYARRPPGAASLSPADAAPDGEPTDEPTTEPSESPPPPTPTPTPSPTPTAAPATTRPPSTTPPASHDNGVDAAFGPRPPGSVTVPYHARQTAWDVTSNGVHIHVALSAVPRAGSQVTWSIDASAPGNGCCTIYLLFGDGYGAPSNGTACESPDRSVAWPHTYNRGGVHRFMVQVGPGCGGTDGMLYGSFDVDAGTSTAQGPALPAVKFDQSTPVPGHESDPAWVSLWGQAVDDDGWVRKLVVSFGDGTSKTFAGDPNPCRPGLDGWPNTSEADLPYQPPPAHHFTKPGTYQVTLTAYSSACDGSEVQMGKASFEWVVPGPQTPEPTNTP